MSDERIVGYSWGAVQRAQQKKGRLADSVDTSAAGDWGADPVGSRMFRMVPSGDIVDYDERCRRLNKNR